MGIAGGYFGLPRLACRRPALPMPVRLRMRAPVTSRASIFRRNCNHRKLQGLRHRYWRCQRASGWCKTPSIFTPVTAPRTPSEPSAVQPGCQLVVSRRLAAAGSEWRFGRRHGAARQHAGRGVRRWLNRVLQRRPTVCRCRMAMSRTRLPSRSNPTLLPCRRRHHIGWALRHLWRLSVGYHPRSLRHLVRAPHAPRSLQPRAEAPMRLARRSVREAHGH